MAHSGQWSYAVPLEETDGNARPLREQTDYNAAEDAKGLRQTSSAWDLMSDSETTKQRRTSLRATNTAAGRKRSRNQLRENRPQDEKTGERVDDSAWIHRDKLAQIEIQEMEAAGIYMRSSSRRSESAGPGPRDRRTSRSVSRSVSRSRRPMSRTSHERQNEINNDEDYAAAYPGHEESPRKRVSTVLSATDEEAEASRGQEPERYDSHFDHQKDGEFRSAEEVAAELQRQRQQQPIPPRPGTSRIPISRISPVPVPQQVVDRDSPLPRSRADSQNWNGSSFDEMQYARKARSGSISSQVLLDSDPDALRTTPPGSSNKTSSNEENSPTKTRVPKKTAPTGRKASVGAATAIRSDASHQKSRTTSASATRRPGSNSGHKSRPSTSHYTPEGEAPWISTMYKPDPRLPPDQQMLPTHKKRMMQEQWEKEGKTGTVYDRDFNLLNDEEIPPPKRPILSVDSANLAPPPRSPSPQKDRSSPHGSANGGPWPLSPKSDTRSDSGSVRPGTSRGYKITPTIPSTPSFQRSPVPSPAPPQPMAQTTPPRVPELDEKDEAQPSKKGCCCVVM
ncbi:Hypothetical predicted protein [Lecanosticta acicola]|uniref:TeaA receptor TeaR n=1 Tax=Lecanosticta acicola TaxID=111012 RepID=A0AAI8Z7F7_9PEZI|nr:Hypothetical predicted protein [Lecanosticta acicola]